jgi:hypothetical protein
MILDLRCNPQAEEKSGFSNPGVFTKKGRVRDQTRSHVSSRNTEQISSHYYRYSTEIKGNMPTKVQIQEERNQLRAALRQLQKEHEQVQKSLDQVRQPLLMPLDTSRPHRL